MLTYALPLTLSLIPYPLPLPLYPLPLYLLPLFDLVDPEPTRVTRHTTNQLNLKQGSFQTELRKHAFAIRAPKMWNALPNQVREARTLNLFKNRYDDHWRQERMK